MQGGQALSHYTGEAQRRGGPCPSPPSQGERVWQPMQVWSPSPMQHRPPCPGPQQTLPRMGPAPGVGLSLSLFRRLDADCQAKLLVCIPQRGEVSSRAAVDSGGGRNVEGASQGCTCSPGVRLKAVHVPISQRRKPSHNEELAQKQSPLGSRGPIGFSIWGLGKEKKDQVPYVTLGSKFSSIKWENKPRYSSSSQGTRPVPFGGNDRG